MRGGNEWPRTLDLTSLSARLFDYLNFGDERPGYQNEDDVLAALSRSHTRANDCCFGN